MCTAAPLIPQADPQFEYHRHTMTQPWCDWTLALEAMTLIGVYTNVPSGGHPEEPAQVAWLQTELQAAAADRPLAVSLHHPPASVDAHHGGSKHISDALDQAIEGANRVPDLVLSGHVHNFQLFRRTAWAKEIVYVVVGNSGYQNVIDWRPGPRQAQSFQTASSSIRRCLEYGFLSLTVDGSQVSGEYVGVTPGNMDDGSDAGHAGEVHVLSPVASGWPGRRNSRIAPSEPIEQQNSGSRRETCSDRWPQPDS